jgi:hypothetical protein
MNISELEKLQKNAAKHGNLRTVRLGGYDKQDTLNLVDGYNAYILDLKAALEDKKNGVDYNIPRPNFNNTLPRSVRLGGFDKVDVDTYVKALKDEIDRLLQEFK